MIKLVVVTGSGRSGTSSVAGTLKRLGFHIPQPEKQADEWNTRGYYEPSFVSGFHAKWFHGLRVRDIDSRPEAGAIVMADLTPEREERLRAWLADQLSQRAAGDVVVIKETRAYWVYPMWQRVAAATGAELVSLTMLRHPAQVVRSRDSKHLSERPDDVRVQRETTNVAAWMNSVFITEQVTRDNPRAFVPYVDLIGDWRTAITRACAQLGVEPGDLTAPHPVDEFVSGSLNHAADSWEGLNVPASMRDLAERTWAAAHLLVEDPADRAATSDLDLLHDEYLDLYAVSAGVAADATDAKVREVRLRLRAQLAGKDEVIERLRERVRVLEADGGSPEITAPRGRRWGSRPRGTR